MFPRIPLSLPADHPEKPVPLRNEGRLLTRLARRLEPLLKGQDAHSVDKLPENLRAPQAGSGGPRYRLLTRGLRAALNCLDDLFPAHNLAGMEDLAVHLAPPGDRPPIRRRQGPPSVERLRIAST